jgi:hypothetical protein
MAAWRRLQRQTRQGKLRSKLVTSQWPQIDESVKIAIEKHPELAGYLVCVSLGRTPAQLTNSAQRQNRWALSKPDMLVKWVPWT